MSTKKSFLRDRPRLCKARVTLHVVEAVAATGNYDLT
jgi:hypothetical protein